MTQQLVIPTPFADLAELTENFAQRVDEQRLMLPCAEPMPEGEWVQFEVHLSDGTSAFAGVGRVQDSYDNGEEHPPQYRYDVVLDSLQFDGRNEVLFERLLVARETMMRGEPMTGEVDLERLEEARRPQAAEAADPEAHGEPIDATSDVSGDVADDAPEAGETGWEEVAGEATRAFTDAGLVAATAVDPEGVREVDPDDLDEIRVPARSAPPPARRAAPHSAPQTAAHRPAPYPTQGHQPGRLPTPHAFNGRPLTRESLPPSWSPEPAPRPDPAQSTGYFDYEGGIPQVAHPPRPDLDPAQKVRPAPRPGAPWPRRYPAPSPTIQDAEAAGPASEEVGAFPEFGGDVPLTTGEETSQYEAPPGELEHDEW
jgi:hypothetical protein